MKKTITLRAIGYGIKSLTDRFVPKQISLLENLKKDWKEIVGRSNSKHSIPTRLRNKDLIVNVDDPYWIQELSLLKDIIKEEINKRYPDSKNYVDIIKFKNGDVKTVSQDDSHKVKLVPDREVIKKSDSIISPIEDKDLKDALRSYFIRVKREINKNGE